MVFGHFDGYVWVSKLLFALIVHPFEALTALYPIGSTVVLLEVDLGAIVAEMLLFEPRITKLA